MRLILSELKPLLRLSHERFRLRPINRELVRHFRVLKSEHLAFLVAETPPLLHRRDYLAEVVVECMV
jgi:hypothetical protein